MIQLILTALVLSALAYIVWAKVLPERAKQPVRQALWKKWIAVAEWMLAKAGA